jgi:hypothetical protein
LKTGLAAVGGGGFIMMNPALSSNPINHLMKSEIPGLQGGVAKDTATVSRHNLSTEN